MRKFVGMTGAAVLAVLLVFAWSGTARAQATTGNSFLLTGNSGGEIQIGTGLPLPVGTAGIFLGGMTMVNGGTSCGMGPGGCTISPDGPGTAYWPPLLIPPNSNISTGGAPTRFVGQNQSTTMGGAIAIPPNALTRPAPGAPVPIAVFPTNPAVFQVATTINFAWPAPSGTVTVNTPMGGTGMVVVPGTVTLASGGAPGPIVTGTATNGGTLTYSGGAKSFGGPGLFAISAGPGAAGGRVPPNGVGALPVASVWINFVPGLPSTVMTVGIAGASNPNGIAAPGGSLAGPAGTTMFGPVLNGAMTMFNGIGVVNIPVGGGGCTMFCVGPLGTIVSSLQPSMTFPSNMVTATKGFPWSTGLVTIVQPAAFGGAEVFFLSGTDMRVAGVGNVSLVSGALSSRALSGPNANRGWLSLTLPEPTAALGALGALGMLGLLHGLVRRRSR